MVPGSTFRYGSHFIRMTRRPRASRILPMEAEAMPLPRLETTPPVMKMYLGILLLFQKLPGQHQVFRRVHAHGVELRFDDPDLVALFERQQLLEAFMRLRSEE